MITIGDTTYALGDTAVIAALAGAGLILLFLILLVSGVRASLRSARLTEPLIRQIGDLGQRVQALGDGQHQLAGGLTHVSEAQAKAQTGMLRLMEERLAQVQEQMNQNLSGSSRRTAQSLGELQERPTVIDKATENITRLSGDVLSLQDTLSNKQTRAALGQSPPTDIVSKALPSATSPPQPYESH